MSVFLSSFCAIYFFYPPSPVATFLCHFFEQGAIPSSKELQSSFSAVPCFLHASINLYDSLHHEQETTSYDPEPPDPLILRIQSQD